MWHEDFNVKNLPDKQGKKPPGQQAKLHYSWESLRNTRDFIDLTYLVRHLTKRYV
jgi:hypothetical protein